MPLFILPIEENTGASHEGFTHTCVIKTCQNDVEINDVYLNNGVCNECLATFTKKIEAQEGYWDMDDYDQGASHADFDIDEFNANNSELYFADTETNCRVCDSRIYANNTDAICDCDLPF
jgi:hypothetical protein